MTPGVVTHARRWAWLALWALLLVVLGTALGARIQLGSDLRLFLPQPTTAAERILLSELKDGPGTRMILLAIDGAPADQLATISTQLTDALRSSDLFERVANGSFANASALDSRLADYRYLLTPSAPDLTTDGLHGALQQRLSDLASPAGTLAQEWLLRDPTGAMQTLIEAWQGEMQPNLYNGVWFDQATQRALLLAETKAPGFDADQQHLAINLIEDRWRSLAATQPTLRLSMTGPGAFTTLLESSIRRDVTTLSLAESVFSVMFLLLVLWSWRHVLLGSLTLATAGLGAMALVHLLNPSVHGITLAFGFTLLGVAMDYPVHYILHLQRSHTATHTLHAVWPTLRLSILTTCIAYLALTGAGFDGLTQLGTFTVGGLLATAVVIRYALPHLVDTHASRSTPRWVTQVQRAPRITWLPLCIILLASIWLCISTRPLWNNELSGLTPIPQALQDLDADLRRQLGAPDLRYLIAIRADDPQRALQRTETLRPLLAALQDQQVIGGFAAPTDLLPSVQTQQQRQQQLPDATTLQQRLGQAIKDLPFRSDGFARFVDDIERSKQLAPLQPNDLQGTALAPRLASLLFDTEAESVALITLSDVRDLDALTTWQQQLGDDVLLLDLKRISEDLVTRFREHALLALGGALIVIAVLMLWELPWRAALAVLLPVIATLLLEVALLNALGVSLTLFHIVSLLLVGGLCFDYGLFFNRSEASDDDALRTRYAVMACWLSTTGAFALLMISSLPVLDAIGSTVSLGVTLGFFIALLARHTVDAPATATTITS